MSTNVTHQDCMSADVPHLHPFWLSMANYESSIAMHPIVASCVSCVHPPVHASSVRVRQGDDSAQLTCMTSSPTPLSLEDHGCQSGWTIWTLSRQHMMLHGHWQAKALLASKAL